LVELAPLLTRRKVERHLDKYTPLLSLCNDHLKLTVYHLNVGMVLWVGEGFGTTPLVSEMAPGSDFSAAHLQNPRELCRPLCMIDSNWDPGMIIDSRSAVPVMVNVLFKKHEASLVDLIPFKKWLKMIGSWTKDEDSETVLRLLRSQQLLKYHDHICNNLAANKDFYSCALEGARYRWAMGQSVFDTETK
jgi:hypothetical protein